MEIAGECRLGVPTVISGETGIDGVRVGAENCAELELEPVELLEPASDMASKALGGGFLAESSNAIISRDEYHSG
jgi:hypothetical protein